MGCASHITTRATVWADRGRAARAAARPVTVAPGTGPLPGGAGPQTRRAARADRAGAGPRWREVHPRPRRLVGRRPLGPRRHRRHPGVGRDPAAAPPREPRARRRRPDGRAAGQPARFEVKRSSTRSRPVPAGTGAGGPGAVGSPVDPGPGGRRAAAAVRRGCYGTAGGAGCPPRPLPPLPDGPRVVEACHALARSGEHDQQRDAECARPGGSCSGRRCRWWRGRGRGCRRRRTWGPATVRRTRP
jgi:hypothetical protein